MKAVIQRVKEASVEIDNKIFSKINKGLLRRTYRKKSSSGLE